MMCRFVCTVLCGVLVFTTVMAPRREVQAQMAVIDVGAITQLALNLQQAVRLVGQGTTQLARFAAWGDLVALVGELQAAATAVATVYQELATVRQGWLMLSDPTALPGTVEALYGWVQQAQMWGLQSTRGGLETFTRVMDAVLQLLTQMLRLTMRLAALASGGTVGALQYISGLLATALQQGEQLKAVVLAGQHLLIGPALIEQVQALAYPRIIVHEMRGWGRYSPVASGASGGTSALVHEMRGWGRYSLP